MPSKVTREKLESAAQDLWDVIKPVDDGNDVPLDLKLSDKELTAKVIEVGGVIGDGDAFHSDTLETLKALGVEIPAGVSVRKEVSDVAEKKVARKEVAKKVEKTEAPAKKEKEKKVQESKGPRYTRFTACADVLKKSPAVADYAAIADAEFVKHGGKSNLDESKATCQRTIIVLEALGFVNVVKDKYKLVAIPQ